MTSAHTELPTPDEGALAHRRNVVALVRAEIEAGGGWMPFDRYMDLVLYAPGLGYYSEIGTAHV